MRVSGDEVVTGRLAVTTATQALAVERDGALGGIRDRRWQACGNPAGQRPLKGHDVEGTIKIAKTRGSGGLGAAESQGMGQGNAVVTAELRNGRGALATAEHGQHGQGQDRRQGVACALATAGVRHVGESLKQGKASHRSNLQETWLWLPPLLNSTSPANLNQRTTLVCRWNLALFAPLPRSGGEGLGVRGRGVSSVPAPPHPTPPPPNGGGGA